MLLNVSYANKKITQKIDDHLGRPFTLKERWKMGGIGSPKLQIIEASIEIRNLLILDNNGNYCNIEMRPKGILVGFRSLLESYALVVPLYKLTIYKGDFARYAIYCDHFFIKVKADTKAIQKFFKKMVVYKSDNTPKNIEDL